MRKIKLNFNRYYTEIAEDYWNREYLDYANPTCEACGGNTKK